MAGKHELNKKMRAFVDEYLLNENATRSYLEAYGKHIPYFAAASAASKLLKLAKVKLHIDAFRKDQRRRHRAKADRVIQKLAELAFSDIGEILDLTDPKKPKLKAYKDIPRSARRAIQEITPNRFGVKIRLADQTHALDKLARCLGVYQELPPLEVILALLPTRLREEVRATLAASVLTHPDHPGNGLQEPATGQPAPLGPQQPDDNLQGRGDGSRPVATRFSIASQQASTDALLPTGGEEHGVGGEDLDALFN